VSVVDARYLGFVFKASVIGWLPGNVKSDASDVANVKMSELDSSRDTFNSSVQSVSNDASVSDALSTVSSSAQALASSVKSTLSGPDCS